MKTSHKLYIAGIVILLSLSLFLSFSLHSYKTKALDLEHQVVVLNKSLDTLSKENKTLKELRDSADSIVKSREEERKEWDGVLERAKEALSINNNNVSLGISSERLGEHKIEDNDVEEIKYQAQLALSHRLDSNTISVLNDLCERVRGSRCPNPH